jgi:prepilin-type N-terminal cleavage/methylation domain-containing protein
MKKDQGFTLIELIMVVAIMGILFSLAYPGFTAHYNMINLSGSADKLYSQANWAINSAIVREKNAIVRIWPASNEYQFAVDDDRVEVSENIIVPPGETLSGSNRIDIGNNVQVDVSNCDTSNPCVLTYSFSSAVWDDPDVEIDISLADQTARIIAIDEITGLFTLE